MSNFQSNRRSSFGSGCSPAFLSSAADFGELPAEFGSFSSSIILELDRKPEELTFHRIDIVNIRKAGGVGWRVLYMISGF